MPRVSNLDRARIVEAIEGGHESKRAIAIRFNVDPSTVRRIYDKFLETNDVEDRPKSGRTRCPPRMKTGSNVQLSLGTGA